MATWKGLMRGNCVRNAGGKQVHFVNGMEELYTALQTHVAPQTLLLCMGAGDITHLATKVAVFCKEHNADH